MANNASIAISADFSDLGNLQDLLAAARERPHKTRAAELDRVAHEVRDKAAAITAAYPSPYDRIAGDLRVEGTPVFKRIVTDMREGHFLHFGSPSTGAPRDWLHGPAQQGADELFKKVSEAAEPW